MKKHTFIRLSVLALLVLLAVSLCACGSFKDNEADIEYPNKGEIAPGDATGGAGWAEDEDLSSDMTPEGRKIIKTYTLNAETQAFDEAVKQIETLVGQHGGYIERSSVSGTALAAGPGSTRYATYTLRIPADQADAFVGSVGGLLHLTRNDSQVEDVSDTYYSIEARLEELKAERDSLLAIMESVDSKSDYNFWLILQQRLSEIKQQIAVYQRQLMNYDSRVSYSTVMLTVNEVAAFSSTQDAGFLERVSTGFAEGWDAFTDVAVALIVFLAMASPFLAALLIPIAIVAAIVLMIYLTVKKKNQKKQGEASAPSDGNPKA